MILFHLVLIVSLSFIASPSNTQTTQIAFLNSGFSLLPYGYFCVGMNVGFNIKFTLDLLILARYLDRIVSVTKL